MIPLGIHRDIPASVYHDEPGASASRLRTIHNSTLAHLKLEEQTPKEVTWEMEMGTLVHWRTLEPTKPSPKLILQPEKFALTENCTVVKKKLRVVGEMVDWSPNAGPCKAWKREQIAKGLIIVTKDDMDEIDQCAERVLAHPEARELLEGADTEVTLRWETECGTQCKARLDMVPKPEPLGDLKCCPDASRDAFERKVYNEGLHLQAAFYLDGWEAQGVGVRQNFRFIAYERKTGFVSVNPVSQALIEQGRIDYGIALGKFIEATRSGVWPAYPGLQMIDTPRWKRREE